MHSYARPSVAPPRDNKRSKTQSERSERFARTKRSDGTEQLAAAALSDLEKIWHVTFYAGFFAVSVSALTCKNQ